MSESAQTPADQPDVVHVGVAAGNEGAYGIPQRREGSTMEVVDGEVIGVQAGQGVPQPGPQPIDPEPGTYEALMAAFGGPGGLSGPIPPPPG